MKKHFSLILVAACLALTGVASEAGDLLRQAIAAYDSGDVAAALQNIDAAKKMLEREQMASTGSGYMDVEKWDIVKMKKAEYLGKKVKVRTTFLDILSDNAVWLGDIGGSNTYNDSLVDKILSLTKHRTYTFYGTVIDTWFGNPALHIEAIE